MNAFEKQKAKAIDQALDDLILREVNRDMPAAVKVTSLSDPLVAAQAKQLKALLTGKASKETITYTDTRGRGKGLGKLEIPPPKFMDTAEKRNQIMKEAEKEAAENITFRITSPEALDLLGSALRYKNAAFLEYNKRIELGMPRYEAQRLLDVAEGIKRDTEDFVMKSFSNSPQMRDWMDRYESTFKNGYERYFPMLISKKKATGEPYISSESVVNEALKSGDNIRALTAIMGADNKMYQKTLTKMACLTPRSTTGGWLPVRTSSTPCLTPCRLPCATKPWPVRKSWTVCGI
jgi:hypothetical protein